jgi:hypothetical protein
VNASGHRNIVFLQTERRKRATGMPAALLARVARNREGAMVSDLVGFVIGLSLILGLLVWRRRIDHQHHVASALRVAVHAGAARLLDDGSPLAVSVRPPTVWRPGSVRLSIPDGNASFVARAFQTVTERVPQGYEVVIRCGARA